MIEVRVQREAFDPAALLPPGDGAAGAAILFAGQVRADDGLSGMEIEHWPGVTEARLEAFATEAAERFGLLRVAIVHRHGPMRPGETIMAVACTAPHRRAAFDGAAFLMDWLKSRAPFWKKERGAWGERWVEAKDADEDALGRW
ncbi:MAG: molybdenum cofactor biosynthesis protein MoaE [Hasllibacter sp.]